eukprot:s2710_g1.t1
MSGWEAAKLYTVLPCAESDLHVQVNVSYALFSVRQPCVMPTLPECPVSILGVRGEKDRAMAFGAPVDPAIPLFTCSTCGQVYWWSKDQGSASARARGQVDRLVEMVEALRQKGQSSVPDGEGTSAERFLRDGGGSR